MYCCETVRMYESISLFDESQGRNAGGICGSRKGPRARCTLHASRFREPTSPRSESELQDP